MIIFIKIRFILYYRIIANNCQKIGIITVSEIFYILFCLVDLMINLNLL